MPKGLNSKILPEGEVGMAVGIGKLVGTEVGCPEGSENRVGNAHSNTCLRMGQG